MKALWSLGEGTIHTLRVRLLPVRPLAYTTVMTVMDRLARKGVVSRAKRSRAYVYRPLLTSDQVRSRAIERLLTEHFDDSVETLRAYLAQEGNAPRPGGNPGRLAVPASSSPPPVRSDGDIASRGAPDAAAETATTPSPEIDSSLL
jgi:predicted transcriptional regulator